MGGMGGMM